jgi:hypothetical protein
MNLSKLEKANKLAKEIEYKKIYLNKLKYAISESVSERNLTLDFFGCDGVAEFDKKDFKNICKILLPILENDLINLELEFKKL